MYFLDINEANKLVLAETKTPSFCDEECLIEVKSIGVNRADLLQKAGKYPPPSGASKILGLEVCGTVIDCGASVSNVRQGDQVIALLAGGGYAQFVSVHANHLIKLPANFSLEQGAGFIETFITAYQALFSYGNLQERQDVLIHAGASGVGSAAIALAKAKGCYVVITASSEEKCQACLAIGADLAIDYNEVDFLDVCKKKKLTFDVIVDVVAGEYLAKNISLSKLDSSIVILAILGGRYTSSLDVAKMLSKRVSIYASTLRNRTDRYKSELITDFMSEFGELLYQNKWGLAPVIHQVFDWQHAEEAHQVLANNQNIGKVVLRIT